MMHLKIAQNMYIFSRKFRTFPVTEGNEIWHIYFQFTTPARKLTHNTKFKHFWMQKDTKFGNTLIICHFGPENHQNLTQKDTNFEKIHSLTPAKMSTNKESIHFSRTLHFSHHNSNALINPIQHQPTNHFWELLVAYFSNLQTNCDIFRQQYLSAGCHFELLQKAST